MNEACLRARAGRLLIVLLAIGFLAMLAASLLARFRNPQLTVRVEQQVPAGHGQEGGDTIAHLMQEVAAHPNEVGPMLHLVEALMTVKNWEAAETFANRAASLDPRNAQPLYLLGVIRHNQGRPQEAAEFLEKVVALDDTPPARYSLGVLYLHYLGNAEKGVEHLTAGLHDPKASEELKQAIREELEKAPLPAAPTPPAEQPAAQPQDKKPQAAPERPAKAKSARGR